MIWIRKKSAIKRKQNYYYHFLFLVLCMYICVCVSLCIHRALSSSQIAQQIHAAHSQYECAHWSRFHNKTANVKGVEKKKSLHKLLFLLLAMNDERPNKLYNARFVRLFFVFNSLYRIVNGWCSCSCCCLLLLRLPLICVIYTWCQYIWNLQYSTKKNIWTCYGKFV